MPAFKPALVAALFCAWTTAAVAAEEPKPPQPPVPPELPEPPPSPSVVVQGTVAVLLPDGFLVSDDQGRYTLIETMCPAFWLGLERGDKVSIFGGMGTRGVASGAITLLLPGHELPIADGWCQR